MFNSPDGDDELAAYAPGEDSGSLHRAGSLCSLSRRQPAQMSLLIADPTAGEIADERVGDNSSAPQKWRIAQHVSDSYDSQTYHSRLPSTMCGST